MNIQPESSIFTGMPTADRLTEYLLGLYQGKTTRDWYDRYERDLEEATPDAVNSAIDRLIADSDDYDRIDEAAARFIRAASRGLDRFESPAVPDGHFLDVLMRENRELKLLRKDLQKLFKEHFSGTPSDAPGPASALRRLKEISSHYRKLQYGLFPAMEEHIDGVRCVKLMWKIQDDATGMIDELLGMLDDSGALEDSGAFNRIFGLMFLKTGTLLYREEKILFPLAVDVIPADRFEKMKSDLGEYGTAFGVPLRRSGGSSSMSEHLGNREERKARLKEILRNLREDGDIQAMKNRFREILHDLSPEELAEAEQALIGEGVPVEEVQRLCEVHVAAFEDALRQNSRKEKSERVLTGHPVDTYRKENKALKKLLRRFRRSLSRPEAARSLLDSLSEVEKHYARKENQLFPYLEEVGFTGPSKVMWGKHDEIRTMLKSVSDNLSGGSARAGRRSGRALISAMKRMIFMEEKILFPTALRKLPDATWKAIRRGEGEIGYAWIKPGSLWDPDVIPAEAPPVHDGESGSEEKGVALTVGRLLPSQIDLMLKNLPVDVTFVDENDRVRYYSQGRERIFPRSPGIIGREVQNCHPPKSVHVVQKIVDDFKTRKRSEAEFWIQMGGKFIHIRYFPLLEGDVYRGVLEVSQDLTPLRALEGEKRLLDEE